jgi:hypothetical protein
VSDERRTLHLPEDLCRLAEQKFGHRFADAAQLLEYVLRELTRDDAARLDEQELRMIEQRLRELGYL